MLFNLSCQRHFPSKRRGAGGIYCGTNRGPIYGDSELKATWEPLNGNSNGTSCSGRGCYDIPEEGGINTLTN